MSKSSLQNAHLGLLADVSEVVALLAGSTDLQGFLQRTVVMVAEHLHADVCSVYLYNDTTKLLSLHATVGLDTAAVGRIDLQLGEGLVGRALKELRPILDAKASTNPDYRYFPEVGEEPYDAFLAMPIQRGIEKVGVLVVQRESADGFSDEEVMVMRTITSQLATAIENARVLLQVSQSGRIDAEPDPLESFFVKGEPACPGHASGDALLFGHDASERLISHSLEDKLSETGRPELDQAVDATVAQLESLQQRLGAKLPEVASLIFDAHLMMLKDRAFIEQMYELIAKGSSAVSAVARIAGNYIDIFEASKHDYMREKSKDVEDVASRLLANLGVEPVEQQTDWASRIVIAGDLLPSDVLEMTLGDVAAIILVGGGITSHISFLVRSLNIPMVIVRSSELLDVADGTPILMDADIGNVYVNPGDEVITKYRERELVQRTVDRRKAAMLDQTVTKDGQRIKLLANINLLSELTLAEELKAEGVGLYRTEFPFLVRQSIPTEEEQVVVYSKLLARMPDKEVTIRTLDVGGDKVLAYFDDAGEANPALGLRSIRFLLRHRDILEQQLCAILRAGASRPLRIMFPMISSLDEFIEARDCLLACRKDVISKMEQDIPMPDIGMMVELPAVLPMIDEFAKEADFFSIGTNDFIQYMLAVDRTNNRVAEHFCPHHPAVLRGLKQIAAAGIKAGIDVSVCGEMAHDLRFLPFLLGIGITQLSVDPHFLPDLQAAIGEMSVADATGYARRLLAQSTIRGVDNILCRSEDI